MGRQIDKPKHFLTTVESRSSDPRLFDIPFYPMLENNKENYCRKFTTNILVEEIEKGQDMIEKLKRINLKNVV